MSPSEALVRLAFALELASEEEPEGRDIHSFVSGLWVMKHHPEWAIPVLAEVERHVGHTLPTLDRIIRALPIELESAR